MTTTQQTETSWLSWLNPLSYFGSTPTPSLGRSAPENVSKEFSKFLATPIGSKFVSTTPDELQEVRKNLRAIPPKAPPAPEHSFFVVVKGNKSPKKLIIHTNPLFQELLTKQTRAPAYNESPSLHNLLPTVFTSASGGIVTPSIQVRTTWLGIF